MIYLGPILTRQAALAEGVNTRSLANTVRLFHSTKIRNASHESNNSHVHRKHATIRAKHNRNNIGGQANPANMQTYYCMTVVRLFETGSDNRPWKTSVTDFEWLIDWLIVKNSITVGASPREHLCDWIEQTVTLTVTHPCHTLSHSNIVTWCLSHVGSSVWHY